MLEKINLLALYVVARQEGLPIPTDLQVELINHGITSAHLQQAAQLEDTICFVRGCLTHTDEELETMTLADDDRKFIMAVRELLTPDMKDALEEQKQYEKDTAEDYGEEKE